MDIIDFIMLFIVSALAVTICYLEYLRIQLRIDDARRCAEYEKAKVWQGE